MRTNRRDAAFEEYVSARQATLLRYAYVLCGDWHHAEDATATALAKTYVHWQRIRRVGGEDAYVRAVLRRVLVDDSRRPWRREEPTEYLPDQAEPDSNRAADDRAALLEALLQLPLRQRQCVALRYWLDCSVEETANELGISQGSVKTHTHRGIDRLRVNLALT